MDAVKLEIFQSTYEQRFGCCICLGPKLKMVSGQCQHRICDECLYTESKRRACMKKCPLCGLDNSFPQTRPKLPEQVLEIQRCIGIQECQNGCSAQMWYWEVEEHARVCPKSCKSPAKKKFSTPQRKRSRVSDRGQVSTVGTPRLRPKPAGNDARGRLRPRKRHSTGTISC